MKTEQNSLIPVAVCEDDDDLRSILASGLLHFGFCVYGVSRAESLDPLLANRDISLLILDLGLPGEDGLSVAQRLRHERPDIGIVMLTARGMLEERVRGLSMGADLYFVKPVDLSELSAALLSLHRRIIHKPEAASRCWRLKKRMATLETPMGSSVPLTAPELVLLDRFLANPGITIDRQDLCSALDWESDERADHRLEALISRLRKKVVEASPGEPLPIKARHSLGYAFLSENGPEP